MSEVTLPETVLTAPEPAAPEPAAAADPILVGKFALFLTPQGGVVLVYRPKDTETDHKLAIPPMALQMASQASGMSIDDIMAKIKTGELSG